MIKRIYHPSKKYPQNAVIFGSDVPWYKIVWWRISPFRRIITWYSTRQFKKYQEKERLNPTKPTKLEFK